MPLRAKSYSHRLLRRLREVMGGAALSPQAKLDMVVKIIAGEMVADSCSIYILRGGKILELTAVHGLNRKALHRFRLGKGEGLAGDVAENSRPLVLSDAHAHPKFHFDPDLGEEKLQSFGATPITRGGSVLGVLVIQNQAKRVYTNEEVELLQTVSMVLAEAFVAEEMVNPDEVLPEVGGNLLTVKLKGITINSGLALGTAIVHYPRAPVKRMVADDREGELRRLYDGVSKMQASLDQLFSKTHKAVNDESRDVIEAYQMFAQDRGWVKKIHEAIESGLTAEAAVQQTQAEFRNQMAEPKDDYLRERLWDFEDLTNRLLQHLLGAHQEVDLEEGKGVIVVAQALGPAELLDYEKYNIKGLILEEGMHTAHVSIVARALQIPVISRVQDIMAKVEFGDSILMDANKGEVVLRPHEEAIQEFEEKRAQWKGVRKKVRSVRSLPARTLDGVDISLRLNAGVVSDLKKLEGASVDGIGLYRTEIPFMLQPSYPGVQSQEKIYRSILDKAGEAPVVFRTLDIGGDKHLPYLKAPEQENPMLGWRSIRMSLDRPMLLRQQLRALIRAAVGKELDLLFPMVADLQEVFEIKKILRKEIDREKNARKNFPKQIKFGLMIEVPALGYQLREVLPHVDFVSVGTNDLFQFFYATDRTNPHLQNRYDPLAPPFLGFLKSLVKEAHRQKKPISICGEMAGTPLGALALIGLGYRTLSMSASGIGQVKMMIRSTPLKKVSKYIKTLLEEPKRSIRNSLISYAKDNKIII